mgnify:CR=1 FL=1
MLFRSGQSITNQSSGPRRGVDASSYGTNCASQANWQGTAAPRLPACPPTKNGLFHRSKQHRLCTPTLGSPLPDALQGSLYTLRASGRQCSPSRRSHHRVQGRRLHWQHDRNDHLRVRSWYVLVWCRLESSFLRNESQNKKKNPCDQAATATSATRPRASRSRSD